MLLPGILQEQPSPAELSAGSFECSISACPKGRVFPGGCSPALFKMKALGDKFSDTICTSLISQKSRYLEVLKQRINLIFGFNSSPTGFILHFPQPEYDVNLRISDLFHMFRLVVWNIWDIPQPLQYLNQCKF